MQLRLVGCNNEVWWQQHKALTFEGLRHMAISRLALAVQAFGVALALLGKGRVAPDKHVAVCICHAVVAAVLYCTQGGRSRAVGSRPIKRCCRCAAVSPLHAPLPTFILVSK